MNFQGHALVSYCYLETPQAATKLQISDFHSKDMFNRECI